MLDFADPMTLGMIEQEFAGRVHDLIADSRLYKVYEADVLNLLADYNIQYCMLPRWIRDMIDDIDIAE